MDFGQNDSYLGRVSDLSNTSVRTTNKDGEGWTYRMIDSSMDGKTAINIRATISSTSICKLYNMSHVGDESDSDAIIVEDWPIFRNPVFVGHITRRRGLSDKLVYPQERGEKEGLFSAHADTIQRRLWTSIHMCLGFPTESRACHTHCRLLRLQHQSIYLPLQVHMLLPTACPTNEPRRLLLVLSDLGVH